MVALGLLVSDYPKSAARATSASDEKEALALLESGVAPTPEQLAWCRDEPASLDPEDLTRNRREAGLLLNAAFSPSPALVAPAPTVLERAGYAVVGHRSSDDARVHPRLAEALAGGIQDNLQARFSDLWAVDWSTWERLAVSDVRAMAIAWLSSPGRRLLSDLDVLRALRDDPPHDWDPGPTDLTSARLRAAIGIAATVEHHADWLEQHKAVPGKDLLAWAPRSEEVPHVMAQLERGMPPMQRGAALAWLLDQAVHSPIYTFDDLTRDLRQDLPVRLAAAFVDDGELADHRCTGRRLEAMILQHVACMAATRLRDWSTSDLWHLARWLHGALVRSPWFGGDLPALVERLRAHLPASWPKPESSFHPLHPARFRDVDDDASIEGLDAEELAIVAGSLSHYGKESSWTPAPRPLVHELRRIARRPLNPGERLAEEAMSHVPDDMGWSTLSDHVAPPLAARWLLSRVLRAGWMEDAASSTEAASVHETLQLLEADPNHYEWLCFAWMEEGPLLPESAQRLALNSWRMLSERTPPPSPPCVAALGAGVLDAMSSNEIDEVINQARISEPKWRTSLLNVLAERLPPDTNGWRTVIDILFARAADPHGDDKERVESAIFAVRRLGATRRDQDRQRLQEIANLADHPPLSRHSGLRRELRRLGLTPRHASGAD